MKPAQQFDEEIQRMEPGLDRAMLRILGFHVGKERAIDKPDMISDLRKLGFGGSLSYATFERKCRLVIAELRKSGHLVCSSSGDGGYYIAKDYAEYEQFRETELNAKIIDMAETMRMMDAAAKKVFGARAVKGQLPLI